VERLLAARFCDAIARFIHTECFSFSRNLDSNSDFSFLDLV
jgi:hypothetical protein